MNTKNISIALTLLGSLLFATSGRLFSLTPDGWRVFAYKSGQLMLLAAFVCVLIYVASALFEQLRERLRKDAEKLSESNHALQRTFSGFAGDYLAGMQKDRIAASAAHDLAECQAHFAANTALSAETHGLIADLLVRLGRIAEKDSQGNFVATAGKLREKLARLQVTHNGITGPSTIKRAEDFLAVHKTTCEKCAALEAAERAVSEAKTAHATALAALNAFDA